jgi:hypothetical protein
MTEQIVDMTTGEVLSETLPDATLAIAPSAPGVSLIKSIDDLGRIAKMLALSGYFADAKDVSQCAVKILTAIELGFPILSSMTGIHIIKGKPSLSGNLIAAKIKNSGRYNYKIREHTALICTIEFFEKWDTSWESVGVSSFSIEDAKKAGLNGENWNKYPRNMLFSRAISNGYKWFTPDIFLGTSVYCEGEIE